MMAEYVVIYVCSVDLKLHTRNRKMYSERGRYVIKIYIQVKKKEFKINAKIEDVGLNED